MDSGDARIMDALKILAMGWNNQHPGEPCSMAESLLWCRMRLLSIDYSQNRLTAEMATEKKERYLAEYRQNSAKLEMQGRCMAEQAKRYQRIEPLINSFKTAPTIEKAEEIVKIFYGLT